MTRPLPRRSTLLIALVIVVVDQLSKAAASSALREGQSLPLLPHLLSLQLVHNTGAAFSVLQGSTALLGLLSLGVGIGLILWIWHERVLPFWQALAAAALLGEPWAMGSTVGVWATWWIFWPSNRSISRSSTGRMSPSISPCSALPSTSGPDEVTAAFVTTAVADPNLP